MERAKFQIGDIFVDRSTCEVSSAGVVTKLSPRAMAVLERLARRPGEVVTPGELLKELWPRSVTSTNAVHKVLAEIRRAVGDHAIHTVPKRGYRLIAPVTGLTPPLGPDNSSNGAATPVEHDAQAQPADPVEPRLKRRALWAASLSLGAVAVFLATRVGSWDQPPVYLIVTSDRTATLTSHAITDADRRTLDGIVSTVITEFRTAGHDVASSRADATADYTVTLALDSGAASIRASIGITPTNPRLLSHHEEIEAPLADRVNLAEALRRHALDDLSVLLDAKRVRQMRAWHTASVHAYRYAREGNFFQANFTTESQLKAVDRFKAAIAEDPDFGYAYASLVGSYVVLAGQGPDARTREAYRREAQSVRIKASQADVGRHFLEMMDAERAFVSISNPIDAERFWHEKLKAEPHDVQALVGYGQLLVGAKLIDEAEAHFERAIAQNSEYFSPDVLSLHLLTVLSSRGNHDEFIRLASKALEDVPDVKVTLNGLIVSLGYRGRLPEAEMYLERLQSHDPVWAFNARMLLMAVSGRTPIGSAGLQAHLDSPLAASISRGDACFILGDVDCGVRYWRQIEPMWLQLLWFFTPSMEQRWASGVVSDQRYQALLEELGIGKQWRTYMRTRAQELTTSTGIEVSTPPPTEDMASR